MKRGPKPTRTREMVEDIINSSFNQIEAAKKLGVSRQRIQQLIKRHGLRYNSKERLKAFYERRAIGLHKEFLRKAEEAVRLAKQGKTWRFIGDKLDCSSSILSKMFKALNFDIRKNTEKLRRVRNKEILLKYKKGYNISDISMEYGIKANMVFHIVRHHYKDKLGKGKRRRRNVYHG